MSVRMRHTSSHTKNRRSHHALAQVPAVLDKETKTFRMPHRLDETTGMYRGKQIVAKKVVKAKSEKVRGPSEPVRGEKHIAEETSEKAQGLMGRMTLGKAKSRSGFGGGV